jgi:hypothetical protein
MPVVREDDKLSDALGRWLAGPGDHTLHGLIEVFEEKSFAVLFVLLLGVPALPLPTGGATHVFELSAMLLALQLIAGRDRIWLPRRWRGMSLAGDGQRRFIAALMKLIRRLERLSRPRLAFLFERRASRVVFGVLVIAGAVGAFAAPPFSGLDTLPSLGVVLLSLGVLLEDVAVAAAGIVVGAAGIGLEIVLGRAALHAVGSLF